MLLKRDWEFDSGYPDLLDWYQRITTNLLELAKHIGYLFANRYVFGVRGVLIGAFLALGVLSEVKHRRSPLFVLILFFYISVLLVKPGELPVRYLLPLIPLLALYVFEGARQLWSWLPMGWGRHCLLSFLLLLVFLDPYWRAGYALGKQEWKKSSQSAARIDYPYNRSLTDLAARHQKMLTAADIVATMHPHILRYFLPNTIRVVFLPFTHHTDKAFDDIRRAKVTYIYCDKKTQPMFRYIESMIQAYPSHFTIVFENSEAAIYKVIF